MTRLVSSSRYDAKQPGRYTGAIVLRSTGIVIFDSDILDLTL
jgi:hypothetical protein